MTLVSLKTGTQDGLSNGTVLLKIELSDSSSLFIKDYYLNNYPGVFEAGREISPVEEEILRFADACFRAERAGLRLIARAEQTQAGLSRKLEARFHSSACVSAVLSRFVEIDLVNDERYAERWLRSRLARKTGKISGPHRLSAALGSRGIGREAIKAAFDKVLDEETEFALLQRFIAKKPIRINAKMYLLRSRLKHEGFSSPVINRYFEEATTALSD